MQAKREAHIIELADSFGYLIRWRPSWPPEIGCVNWTTKSLLLPTPSSKMAYMSALHEFGHIALKHHRVAATVSQWHNKGPQVVAAEREAWAWAYVESRENVGLPTRRRCLRLLAGYDPKLRETVSPLTCEDLGDEWREVFGREIWG